MFYTRHALHNNNYYVCVQMYTLMCTFKSLDMKICFAQMENGKVAICKYNT